MSFMDRFEMNLTDGIYSFYERGQKAQDKFEIKNESG